LNAVKWHLCIFLLTTSILCSCVGNDLSGDDKSSETPFEYGTNTGGLEGEPTKTMLLPTETGVMGVLDFPRIEFIETQWFHYPLAYNLPTGYTSNTIRDIEYTEDMGMWFSTPTSIWCYMDGEWRMYTEEDGLLSSNSDAIAYDPSGKIWIGTDAGISVYDGVEWINYPKGEGLLANFTNIREIDITANLVWVVYDFAYSGDVRGISSFDGTNWITYETNENIVDGTWYENILSVASTQDGYVWFGIGRYGVLKYDGQTWINYPVEIFDDGINLSEHPKDVVDIRIFNEGELWLLTTDLGITLVSETGWETIPFEQQGYGYFRAFEMSPDGSIWVGGDIGNTLRVYRNGGWQYFYYGDLPFHHVYDIEITPEGEIWLATGNGVYRYLP
jgi:ligand-binding sensor domain-containing protein